MLEMSALLRGGARTVAPPHHLVHVLGRPARAASSSAPAAAPASWRRPIAAPLEAGGKSIGLSIELPHEQWPNPYISPELSFQFHYFFMRKLWFAQLAKALIVFPGGFGTMDELWEMLTLMQTGKLQRRNLILIYGRQYWDRVLNWQEMLRCGTINRHEYDLLQFADTVDEAFDRVRRGPRAVPHGARYTVPRIALPGSVRAVRRTAPKRKKAGPFWDRPTPVLRST